MPNFSNSAKTFALTCVFISIISFWFVTYAATFFVASLNMPLEIALGFQKFFEPQGIVILGIVIFISLASIANRYKVYFLDTPSSITMTKDKVAITLNKYAPNKLEKSLIITSGIVSIILFWLHLAVAIFGGVNSEYIVFWKGIGYIGVFMICSFYLFTGFKWLWIFIFIFWLDTLYLLCAFLGIEVLAVKEFWFSFLNLSATQGFVTLVLPMFALVWILGRKLLFALIIAGIIALWWGVMFGFLMQPKDSENKTMYEQMTSISKSRSKCVSNAFLERFFMRTTLDYPVSKDGQNMGIILSYYLTKINSEAAYYYRKNYAKPYAEKLLSKIEKEVVENPSLCKIYDKSSKKKAKNS